MRPILAVLLVLVCAVSAGAQERPLPGKWIAATIAADLADLGTTVYGVRHGMTELNPALGQSVGRITAVKLGLLAGKLAFFKWAYPRNQKAARLGLQINLAVGFGAATWNIAQFTR